MAIKEPKRKTSPLSDVPEIAAFRVVRDKIPKLRFSAVPKRKAKR
jgi:hypothetical protein